jgi:hypothetical protein
MQQVSKVIHTFFFTSAARAQIRRVKKRNFTNGLHTKKFRRT